MKSILRCLMVTFLLCFSTIVFSEMIDCIIATVNGEVITYNQFRQRLFEEKEMYRRAYSGDELERHLQESRESILDDLIEERLLLEEAKKENIKVDKIDIEKMVNVTKNKFESLDDFNKALKNEGLTQEALEKKYRQSLMVRKLIQFKVNSRVKIEPSEISQYYQTNKKCFLEPEQVKIRQILVKTGKDDKTAEQTAKEILKRIRSGEDMFKKETDIGFINTSELLTELNIAISKLKINEISDLVKTQAGYHIIRLEGRKLSEQKNLSEVRDEIYKILFNEKADIIYIDFMNKLKKKADIEIRKK